ncbi:hypothetical protein NLC27_03390, partial [Candidatus Aminicenantes bacterium AC-708-I09]|nr:hypothetical protein [Candidatus Aminicenantes bacterium AC-708-I09]
SIINLFAQPQKPVEPVNWRKLINFLIDIPGWQAKGEPKGSTVSMGNFKISQVERSYVLGEKDLEIKIIDGSYIPMVYASFKMMTSFEIDSSEEYVKKITVKGFPGVEKYEYGSEEAMIIILVKDRFLVNLTEDNVKDTSELKKIANLLDLKKLAELAK